MKKLTKKGSISLLDLQGQLWRKQDKHNFPFLCYILCLLSNSMNKNMENKLNCKEFPYFRICILLYLFSFIQI